MPPKMIYEIQIAFALLHMLSNDERYLRNRILFRVQFQIRSFTHREFSIFIHYYNVGILKKYRLSLTAMRIHKRIIVSRVNIVLKPNVIYSLIQTSISIKSYIQYSIAPLFAHNVWNRTNESESQETGKHNNSNPQRFREVALAHEFIAVVI